MSKLVAVPIINLKIGEKFYFCRGTHESIWMIDKIEKDNRFPREDEPRDIWKITYHIHSPLIKEPRHHDKYVDEKEMVSLIIN